VNVDAVASRNKFASVRAVAVGDPQRIAGHADLSTTQRYMYLSPAATEDAIRLLDTGQSGVEFAEKFGDILDTREAGAGN
jgi:hypothetical protein